MFDFNAVKTEFKTLDSAITYREQELLAAASPACMGDSYEEGVLEAAKMYRRHINQRARYIASLVDKGIKPEELIKCVRDANER